MAEYISPEDFKKLKKELEHLKTEKRKEVAEKLKKAISFGDLSENAAYTEAKETQAFLEGKILELENKIKNAVVVVKDAMLNIVQIGSLVYLEDDKNRKVKFKIVGAEQGNPKKGTLSVDSPLGKILLYKKEGMEIEIKVKGDKIKYHIKRVE